MNPKQVSHQVILLIVGLALALSMVSGLPPAQAVSSAAAHAAQGISAEFLRNPNGTLNTSTGISAALDMRGRNVTLDVERGPVFRQADNPTARPMADTWSALGTGVGYVVRALAVSGNDVYAGGFFTSAGNCTSGCNRIAKWDGTTWSALGTGTDGAVRAIAISGTDVYVGGFFTSAGDCTSGCNYIAKWDTLTKQWSPLGTGTGDYVRTIVVTGTNVYVGGDFRAAGDCDTADGCNFIAKWDGTTWSALGTGIGGPAVWALAVSGSDLYAGGFFTGAGSCDWNDGCTYIAKWDGTTWSPLGTGMSSTVLALAVSGSELYAGGEFTSAGACTSANGCNYIAKWNGTAWSALGTGMDWNVSALAVSGSDLYAGGDFTSAGSCTSTNGCNYVAQWGGTAWSALGAGTDASVVAFAVSGSDLYAGGDFTNAGSCTSENGCNYIARYGSGNPLVYAEPAPGTCGGNTPCYTSLQTAINTVDASGEVRYYGGTYNEVVSLYKGVTLNFVGNSNVTIGGNLIVSSGTFNAPGAYTLSLTGDLTNSGGTFNHNGGTVVFAGSGTQTITGDFTFNNLTVNSGAALDVGTYTLTVAGSGTASSNQQDVTGAADFTFLGLTGVVINPGASLPLGQTGVTIRFLPAGTTSCVTGGQATVRRCFQINPSNTAGRNATVRFYFDATRDLSGLTCAALKAYHHDGGGGWSLAGGTGGAVTCNGTASYIEVSGVTDFSDFVLGDPSTRPTAITLRVLSASVGPDGIWSYVGIGLALAGLLATLTRARRRLGR